MVGLDFNPGIMRITAKFLCCQKVLWFSKSITSDGGFESSQMPIYMINDRE